MPDPFSADDLASEGGTLITKIFSVAVRHLPSNQQRAGNKKMANALKIIEELETTFTMDEFAEQSIWHEYDLAENERQLAKQRAGLFGIRASHRFNDMAGKLEELARVSSTQTKAKAMRQQPQQGVSPVFPGPGNVLGGQIQMSAGPSRVASALLRQGEHPSS